MKKKILITGANGQLGQSLKQVKTKHLTFFASSDVLDITCKDNLESIIQKGWDYCINTAAYTAVDKAENQKEEAFNVNAKAVGNLAYMCQKYSCKFIHISTDYVFNGISSKPYQEKDTTDPINTYGESKLQGEILALENNLKTFIIRTSWLYSEYQNNFVKTMLELAKNNQALNIVNDQLGSPTYSLDLARAIMKIIDQDSDLYGIYHYANKGETNWADFAKSIFKIQQLKIKINGIPSSEYPTKAKRPLFSVLNTHKIEQTFNLTIPKWEESLVHCLNNL